MDPEEFGSEFVNMAASALRSVTADQTLLLAAGLANAQTLLARIARLAPSGGYLYFPAGRYPIARPVFSSSLVATQEFGDIVVPPNVTLWFEPGAFLEPLAFLPTTNERGGPDLSATERASVRIEILGDIIASRTMIFAPPRAALTGLLGVGLILLAGNRIREVYPEWWGALGAGENFDAVTVRNTAALQAMVDAAYHRRVTPQRASVDALVAPSVGSALPLWHHRPSIPMVLLGIYPVHRPIEIGYREGAALNTDPLAQPPLGGFELFGERGASTPDGGRPAITAYRPNPAMGMAPSRPTFAGGFLVSIRGPMGYRIEGLTLDAGYLAPICLKLGVIDGDWASSTIEGTSVLRGGAVCLEMDGESLRRPVRPGRPLASPITDCWNCSFTRCVFQFGGTIGIFFSLGRGDLNNEGEFNLTLVDLRLGDNQGLELRGCWLRGPASPGIRARSGRFALNNCLMHLTRPPRLRRDGTGAIARENFFGPTGAMPPPQRRAQLVTAHPDWGRPDYAHGTDVFIDSPLAAGERSSGTARIIPAAFTAREIQSHSWQLLATKAVPPGLRPASSASAVILMNVRQACEFDKLFVFPHRATESSAPINERIWFVGLDEYDPPSVYWCTGGPGSLGAPLIMIGTQFPGTAIASTERSAAIEQRTTSSDTGLRALPIEIGLALVAQTVQVGPMVSAPIYAIGADLNSDSGFASTVLPLATRFGGTGASRELTTVRRLAFRELR